MQAKYPAWSPYSAMLDNPLVHIDVKGDSVELIIGRPYTDASGETHPYGHMALRVFNATDGYNMVYDYGRYGKTWGLLSSEGEGILNVYTDAKSYMKDEQSLRSSVGYMQPTSVADDKKVMDFFQNLIKQGEVYKGTNGEVPGGGGTAYKLKQDYHYNNSNCVTLSCDGLRVIGIEYFEKGANRPNDAFDEIEKSYQTLRLQRTSYPQNGKAIITWIPPKIKQISLEELNKLLQPPQQKMPRDKTFVPSPPTMQFPYIRPNPSQNQQNTNSSNPSPIR